MSVGSIHSLVLVSMSMLLAGSSLLGVSTAVAAPITSRAITDLGTLGGSSSAATAINAAGQVVGGATIPPYGREHAFLWQPGHGMKDLGALNGSTQNPVDRLFSRANAINNHAQVVGASYTAYISSNTTPFLWQAPGGMLPLPRLGFSITSANGINTHGHAVGRLGDELGDGIAVLWVNGNVRDLGNLGSPGVGKGGSSASGINSADQIVGHAWTASGSGHHAFLWQNGNMRDLGTLGGADSSASAINDRTQVIGSSSTTSGRTHAFLWQSGKMRDIGDFAAQAINDQGDIVGAAPATVGLTHAVLWRGGKLTDLNTLLPQNSGWVLQSATGINIHRQIVGMGQHNGQARAFLLEP